MGIIHLLVVVLLACATIWIWQDAQAEQAAKLRELEEREWVEEEFVTDPRANVIEEGKVMGRVALPMAITVIYAGAVTVLYLMPALVDRFTQEVLGSAEEVEEDEMHGARAAYAQGNYDEAVRFYRGAWAKNPEDRYPVVEMVKIQRENLKNPEAALALLQEALQQENWRESDRAFFMFRSAEINEQDLENHEASVAMLREIMQVFPETRHSANATHKLRELGELV